MCSHFGARVRRPGRHMLRETARAQQQVPPHFDGSRANGSLFAPAAASCSLASHRMTLTKECKNPSWIAREIELFSIWLVLTLIPKHYSRFRVFCQTICWTSWLIYIYETFSRNKIAVSSWNPFSAPCSDEGSNLRTSHFVNCWLKITELCTEVYIGITMVYWNRINQRSGVWAKKYGKWNFDHWEMNVHLDSTILQNWFNWTV